MLRERLHEYFAFTKKERIGVLTLIALIIVVFELPYLFSPSKSKSNAQDFEQFRNQIAQLKVQQTDSNRNVLKNENKEEEYTSNYDEPVHKNEVNSASLKTFKKCMACMKMNISSCFLL